MGDNREASESLIPCGPRAAANFPQQGSIDWVAIGKSSILFTVEAVSRISKAGVEALTIYAARAIFNQVKLGHVGQLRIQNALQKLRAFSSMNSVLWFGFGAKHVIRGLSESAEGLACIGICSCLTEEFSTAVSAKILHELFLLYQPPAELTPALRQWTGLVEACQGAVASTEFGLITSELARLCLRDGTPNLMTSSKPAQIAKVLKGLFDVSNGTMSKVYITGGADCAWLAAVAHWLLELSVQVQDQEGNIIYRPGSLKDTWERDAQIILCYDVNPSKTSAIVQRSYFVPSGRLLLHGIHEQEENLISHGRVPWPTCLEDVFGQPMKKLLTSQAAQTGLCLGAAARILEHLTCRERPSEFPQATYDEWQSIPQPTSSSSYGRGFYLKARELLLELHKSPCLLVNMENMLNQTLRSAVREYSESMDSIRRMCECRRCKPPADTKDQARVETLVDVNRNQYCSVFLIEVICGLVRLSSQLIVSQDLPLFPTHSGIQLMYWDRTNRTRIQPGVEYDFITSGLVFGWSPRHVLFQARSLFTGRGERTTQLGALHEASAIAADGLCFFSSCLSEFSIDAERAFSVYVIPGRIQWNEVLYDQVRDTGDEFSKVDDDPYLATTVTRISTYDELKDSSSSDLEAKLYVDEVAWNARSIVATWHITSKSTPGFFTIGPRYISEQISLAHPAAHCDELHGRFQDVLCGFRSLLVEGEGVINQDWLNAPTGDPVVRVLGNNPLAVWIALSQANASGSQQYQTRDETRLRVVLQGRQCIQCCIMKANSLNDGNTLPVCILTNI